VWRRCCAATPTTCFDSGMGYTVRHAADAFWGPSNQMRVPNTDLAKQLGATMLGAAFNDTDVEGLWLVVGAQSRRPSRWR
jgi:hypothetical protein